MYYKIIEGKTVYSECKTIELNGVGISNPTAEQIAEAGWLPYVPPIHVRTLEEAKREKIYALESYDASPSVNSFTLGNEVLWLTPNDRTNYLLTMEAAKDAGISTVPFHGYSVPVEMAISIIKAVSIYAMQCVGVTDSHKAAINALETIEEVDAYDFETGYPEKLNFVL